MDFVDPLVKRRGVQSAMKEVVSGVLNDEEDGNLATWTSNWRAKTKEVQLRMLLDPREQLEAAQRARQGGRRDRKGTRRT